MNSVPTILALGLEGALISNVEGCVRRPGLKTFLEQCALLFQKIVMFTQLPEETVWHIAERLVHEGNAPDWFARIHCIRWNGLQKDLSHIVAADSRDVIFVDLCDGFERADQRSQCVGVEAFDPSGSFDIGLYEALRTLRMRLDMPGLLFDSAVLKAAP